MTIPTAYCLFCGPDDAEGEKAARDYIARQGLTKDDVRLSRTHGSDICVITKREVTLAE